MMKQKYWIRLLGSLLCITLLVFCMALPASAAPEEDFNAWIEARATVPDGFNGIVILTVEHQDLMEEYSLECLADNNYVGSRTIPAGTYNVTSAFVYQNYTYSVAAKPATFTVEADSAAASIELIVTAPEEELPASEPQEDISPQVPEQDSSVPALSEPVESAPEPDLSSGGEQGRDLPVSEPLEDEDAHPVLNLLVELAFSLVGALLFGGFVFGVCWLYRRYKENNS